MKVLILFYNAGQTEGGVSALGQVIEFWIDEGQREVDPSQAAAP